MAVPFLDATDSVAWAGNLNGQSYDDLTFDPDDLAGDSATLVVTVTPSFAEDSASGSLGTANVKVTPSVVEFLSQEVATFSVVVTPSFVGLIAGVDSNTIPVSVKFSGVEPQFGLIESPTWNVKVTPSGTDLLAHQYSDSATVGVLVGLSGFECYNIAVPNYEVVDFKKWEVEEGVRRWSTEEIGNRWQVFEIVGSFDNECR